jgi:hypothetical protein
LQDITDFCFVPLAKRWGKDYGFPAAVSGPRGPDTKAQTETALCWQGDFPCAEDDAMNQDICQAFLRTPRSKAFFVVRKGRP